VLGCLFYISFCCRSGFNWCMFCIPKYVFFTWRSKPTEHTQNTI